MLLDRSNSSFFPKKNEPLIFHMPILSQFDFGFIRSSGPGLGNLLFPLCRAVVGAQKSGHLVFPTMRQLKIGPLLRRENDLRTYGDVFEHRSKSDWRNWILANTCAKLKVNSALGREINLVKYIGMGRQFHDLHNSNTFLRDFLWSRSRYKPSNGENPDIGIHIRQGDFEEYDPKRSGQSYKMPLSWYLEALEEAMRIIKRTCDSRLKIVMFTDGSKNEISNAFKFHDIEFDNSKTAMCSILRLSQSRIIIGSRSTFSIWASFLSEGESIWPASFELSKFKPLAAKRDIFV